MKLYGIGVGPGDGDLITIKAIKAIKNCSIIAVPKSGDNEKVALKIAKNAIEDFDKQVVEINMPMTRDKDLLNKSHNEAANTIIDYLKKRQSVGFLTLGDPSIYSTYTYIHKRVLDKGYEAEIIPGVPSFCAVAAKLNIPLVEGGEALHIIPASYENLDDEISLSGTKVLMKSGKSIGKVKSVLKEKNMEAKMVQKCGMEGERIYKSLDEIDEKSSYFSIVVVKDVKNND